MRVKFLRILLFLVFLPVVVLKHLFKDDKDVAVEHQAIGRRLVKPVNEKLKRDIKIDSNEMDKLLHMDISTENIL